MLIIHDEELAKKLTQIAHREKRPVEAVLKSMVAQYPLDSLGPTSKSDEPEMVRHARRKVYAKARQYWSAIGEQSKAAMTDEELDVAFGAFDEEGIPRLKSELASSEPPPGSLAYAAKIAEQGNFNSGRADLARSSKEILDEHFAADISNPLRGADASEQHSH